MYDELLERLRNCIDSYCAGCKYESLLEPGNFVKCMNALTGEAADAIEELSMKLHGDEAAIAGMKREIERMVVSGNMPRWIPATERLPDAGERVLCYCRANIYEVMKMRTNGDWVHDTNHVYMHSFVTHWMPLPESPKEET